MKVAEVVIEHVRRRIERAQGAIQRQRRRGEGHGHALRKTTCMMSPAAMYSLVRATAALYPASPNSLAAWVIADAVPKGMATDSRSFRRNCVEPRHCVGIGAGRVRIGVDDQRDLAAQVVDDREFLGQEQQHVGNVGESGCRRLRRMRKAGFDVPDGVVAEVPGESAAEARQSRQRRRAKTLAESLDETQRIAHVGLDDAVVVLHLGATTAHTQPDFGRQSDERVSSEAFAADHRLQQERIARGGELQVQRQRGIEVRKRLEHERDAVVALGGKGAKFGFGDHASTLLLLLQPVNSGRRWGLLRATRDAKDQEGRCQRHSPLRRHPVTTGRHKRLERSTFMTGSRSVRCVSLYRAGRAQAFAHFRESRSATASSESTIPSAASFCTGTPSL